MTRVVSRRPSDFVRYLTSPGLPIPGAGSIPLSQYVCAVEDYGGNHNAEEVIGTVNRRIPLDPHRPALPDGQLAPDNRISLRTRSIGRMSTGQGYPDDFILVMGHIARNVDAVKRLVVQPWRSERRGRHLVSVRDGAPRPIGQLFGGPDASAAVLLEAMVRQKVFGMDCIGFVSQYLVYAGVWRGYKRYYPSQYTQEFRPIASLGEIQPLAVLMWANDHVAIIDAVKERRGDPAAPSMVVVDICQSSSGGPQLNRDVEIVLAQGQSYQSHQLFRFRNRDRLPVSSPAYIGVMPGLVYQGEPAFIAGGPQSG
jgi:hypothetical protein